MRGRLWLCMIAMAARPLAGQDASDPSLVPLGVRVRVSAPAVQARAIVGVLEGLRRDSLVLRDAAGEGRLAVPLGAVDGLAVSRGRHHHVGRGVFIGALAGAVGGSIAALAACHANPCDEYTGLAVFGLGAAGALGGMGLGAVVGALVPGERWEDVPLDRLRVGFTAPPRPSVGLGLSLPFRLR